ncbi:hypothetical protein AAKU67_001534 [Oxalobacteraceae bacterium GrIS 2.11]
MKASRYLSHVCIALVVMVAGVSNAATSKEPVVSPFEDNVQVDGQTLLLNGSGPLSVNRVKIYTVGIYMPVRKSTAQEILALPGIVRVKIAMLKSVESETMSRRFIADVHANTSKDDRLIIANQILTLGMGFGAIGDWNVGDVMYIDWIPSKGTVISWNNKQVAEPLKNQLLMQSILKIWLGDNVYDTKLKRLLLGVKE